MQARDRELSFALVTKLSPPQRGTPLYPHHTWEKILVSIEPAHSRDATPLEIIEQHSQ
jgi:hypothetical protein